MRLWVVLSTASVSGSLLGPMIGGYIAETLGFQPVFFITGALLLISFITTALFVKESFTREDKKVLSFKETWSSVPEKSLTLPCLLPFLYYRGLILRRTHYHRLLSTSLSRIRVILL